MLKKYLLLTFLFSLYLNASIFTLDKIEAQYAKKLLQTKKAILVVSNGTKFQYKIINSLDIAIADATSNMFHQRNSLAISNDYNIKVNGTKIDFVSTYVRDNRNKNKWVRLGSLVDPETFKNYLNDVYYTYTKKEKIPSHIEKNTKPVKNNGRPSVVMIPDEEYNQKQKEKEESQVYEELEQRHISD